MTGSPTAASATPVRLGVLGCGIVGSAFAQLVAARADAIAARTGIRLEITRVAVRSTSRSRPVSFEPGVLTHDAAAVVADPDVDLVVELIGGIEPARHLILDALKSGKPVVTANKELLANVGPELYATAEAAGVDLLFEAAVAGGIPLVRPLRESLVGEQVHRVLGIVNGTTNYILTRMAEEGASYQEALAEAQSLGYAERDPTADVEGYDAGAKAAILATLAFGVSVCAGDVYHEGISALTSTDIAFAGPAGLPHQAAGRGRALRRRLRGGAGPPGDGPGRPPPRLGGRVVQRRVHRGRAGRAADVLRAGRRRRADRQRRARRRHRRGREPAPGHSARVGQLQPARIRPIDDLESAYYLHLEVSDRPGVLAQVATVFGRHGVSIRSMEQEGLGEEARCVFITHNAREADVQATLGELRGLDALRSVRGVLRVIEA